MISHKLGLKNGIKISDEYYERAKRSIGSGTNTFSRAPGVFPDVVLLLLGLVLGLLQLIIILGLTLAISSW